MEGSKNIILLVEPNEDSTPYAIQDRSMLKIEQCEDSNIKLTDYISFDLGRCYVFISDDDYIFYAIENSHGAKLAMYKTFVEGVSNTKYVLVIPLTIDDNGNFRLTEENDLNNRRQIKFCILTISDNGEAVAYYVGDNMKLQTHNWGNFGIIDCRPTFDFECGPYVTQFLHFCSNQTYYKYDMYNHKQSVVIRHNNPIKQSCLNFFIDCNDDLFKICEYDNSKAQIQPVMSGVNKIDNSIIICPLLLLNDGTLSKEFNLITRSTVDIVRFPKKWDHYGEGISDFTIFMYTKNNQQSICILYLTNNNKLVLWEEQHGFFELVRNDNYPIIPFCSPKSF